MQWLMLGFTVLAMTVLRRLARAGGGPLEARATLALGFLILAAYFGGEIARRFRLPRITGYLLTGLVLGPPWLGVVRDAEVQALRVIATGAVALVAFAAGNELRLSALRTNFHGTLRLAVAAIAFPFVAVTLVVVSVGAWFPLTAHQPFRDTVTVALVLGAIAAVSSPIVTWGVISDSGARSALSRRIFHVTVLQDTMAIVFLVLLLALAQPLASSGAVTWGITTNAVLHFAGSLAAGALLGMGIADYAKVIRARAHTTLVLLAAAFFVAQAVRLLELEPVLIGLAAGCALANTAQTASEQVKVALEQCMLPVYIVFFALAGMDLRLDTLGALWPWVLLLVGLRITGLRVGFRWAGRDSAAAVSSGWLGMVSQGALAISLAAVLRRAFPEWGITLESLILAMIGVHLIAGPICFQWVLRRAGDITEGTHGAEHGEVGGAGATLVRGTGSMS
jgi:Kef-type K+ transport system membrane component KefB